ncbi:uncharacterized protein TNCV_5084721 [Trichonephila clavipes]|uniref:Uncharacterized protein n=1 Tax=Trichonephila clavipes TaxID=2585209 RepID=A0A8X6S9N5_TRICX|nr:uncharacterized protein TNCV_5084721 [Trichonephila clavipes]
MVYEVGDVLVTMTMELGPRLKMPVADQQRLQIRYHCCYVTSPESRIGIVYKTTSACMSSSTRFAEAWTLSSETIAAATLDGASQTGDGYQDGRIRIWWHRGERTVAACIRHRRTGPSPGVTIRDAIGYASRSPLVRIDSTLNSARYISGHTVERRELLQKMSRLSETINGDRGSPVVKVSDHDRHVRSSSPVPLKTHRVAARCTLILSRAQTSSHWCSVVVRRGDANSGVVLVT